MRGHPLLQHWFAYQSKATPFTSEACKTNHSQVRKEVRTESFWEIQLGTCVLGDIVWTSAQ